MKLIIRSIQAVIFLSAVFTVFACSAKQEVSLQLSGEGEGTMEIVLHPVLTSYLTDLSMAVSDPENSEDLPIFDEIGIWNGFARNDSIELISVDIPERERLVIKWRFTDLNGPFEGYPDSEIPVLSFTKDGDKRVFNFQISTENFYQVSGYFPLIDEDLLAYFGPNPEDPVPEELYIEDLEFAMEDYLTDQSMSEVLEDSVISFMIRPEGEIISNFGGIIKKDGVLYEIPLVKFLTLNEPISWSLVFSGE